MDNGGHDDSWNGAHWKGEYHHPPISTEEIRWHDAVPTDWPLPSEPIIGREHRRTPSFQVCTSEFRESLLSEESHHGQKKPCRQKGSSHTSPLRWTPEILSLMLGIVAIVGECGGLYLPSLISSEPLMGSFATLPSTNTCCFSLSCSDRGRPGPRRWQPAAKLAVGLDPQHFRRLLHLPGPRFLHVSRGRGPGPAQVDVVYVPTGPTSGRLCPV